MTFTNRLVVTVACVTFLTGWMWAQGGATGAISGVVQDSSGAVIAGAKVSVKSEGTGEVLRQVTTDSSGLFTATLLPVGSYAVEVNAAGFSVTRFPGVAVRITETTRMTAVMKVTSATKEVIEVQSQVENVNTTDATTGESLGSTTITTLPLATRNFQQLLTLSAGASSDLNNASQLGRGNVFIHVNGGREDNNNYLIEGISASDYAFGELTYTPLPNPDAIQEFKVSTSLYDASQGRNGGGNINASLKSGTSHFHGDVWEYFRNTALDAHDYFLGKIDIKQNIFGGDFGGPVGKDARFGFFYVNYQGTRQRSGASAGTFINNPAIPLLPQDRSPANLMSVFNVSSIDPVLSNAQNTGLLQLLDTAGQFGPKGGFLFPSGVPLPGCAADCVPGIDPVLHTVNSGQFLLSKPGRFSDNQFTANWDREFRGGRDHLSERFFWSNSDTFEPFGADSFQIQTGGLAGTNNLNYPLDVPLRSRFGSITETHVFANNLVNEFRFGINIISDKLNNQAPITGAQIGINLPTATGPLGDPNIYRFQFGSWAYGPYPTQLQYALSDNFAWIDTVGWTHKKHQFRFGGEADRVTLRRALPVADNGLVFFAGPQAPTDFQGFLEGSPFFGEAGGGAGNHDYRIPAYAWFAQDDYRATKSLTLNLGFRNEFLGAPYDELCHIGNTNPLLANTTGQPFIYPTCVNKFKLPGLTGTQPHSGLNNNWASVWEPRIGFAYALPGRHTTSIRGGYSIYSVREDLGAVDNLSFSAPIFPIGINFLPGPAGAPNGGLANLFQPCNPATPPCGFTTGIPHLGEVTAANNASFVPTPAIFQGFPATAPSAACPSLAFGAVPVTAPDQCSPAFSGNINSLIALAVPLHWVAATTQQWNFTIQRELGKDWFLEVGYVGTKGTRLRSTFDPDQATLATPQNPVTIPYACTGGAGSCSIVDSTAENASARAPYRGIAPANFEEFAPNSDSHYHSLQVSLAHHFSKGVYFQSGYTWSKSIDDVSTASVAFDTRFNDQNNARDSRGLSDFDRRHRFVTSGVYQLPFFANASGLTKGALGGWEASGVLTLQSGTPITIVDPAGGSAYALSSPNLATATFASGFSCGNAPSSGSIASRLSNWVKPNAYTPDATLPIYSTTGVASPGDATVYGNSPRNCIIGPQQKNVDFTLGKTFKLGEQQNLRFRADFFNLFNHPSFANPAAPVVSAAGASAPITSVVGTPRLIQFSLKYSF